MKDGVPNILLVDDDPQVVKYLRRALEKSGYTVDSTTSASGALAMMKNSAPDLLILDLNMFQLYGFDRLRIERSEAPEMRILVISGYLKGPLLEAAKMVGAIDTLEKPVTEEALVSKVRQLLGDN